MTKTLEELNGDDLIDTRDLAERLNELKDMDAEDMTEDELEELECLRDLADDIGSEWRHGVTLIADSHFEEYTRDLLDDLGYIPRDLPDWIEIDYQATANNLLQDYSETSLGFNTYYYRTQ